MAKAKAPADTTSPAVRAASTAKGAKDLKGAKGKGATETPKATRTGKPRAPRKDSYHHGDLRRAILDAAKAELQDVGPEALSLRGAARRAGVSHAAPYHHFADKETLLAHLVADGFRVFSDALNAGADTVDVDDPMGRLLAVGAAYLRFATAEPAYFSLITGGCSDAHQDIWLAPSEAAFGVLLNAVTAVRTKAGIEGDAHDDAMLHWSLVHGLAKLGADNGLAQRMDIEALWQRLSHRINALYPSAGAPR